jgi:hypothetical protein
LTTKKQPRYVRVTTDGLEAYDEMQRGAAHVGDIAGSQFARDFRAHIDRESRRATRFWRWISWAWIAIGALWVIIMLDRLGLFS